MMTWLDTNANITWEQFVAYATANGWHYFKSGEILGRRTVDHVKVNFIKRRVEDGVAVSIEINGSGICIPTSYLNAYNLAQAVAIATGGWVTEPKFKVIEGSLALDKEDCKILSVDGENK